MSSHSFCERKIDENFKTLNISRYSTNVQNNIRGSFFCQAYPKLKHTFVHAHITTIQMVIYHFGCQFLAQSVQGLMRYNTVNFYIFLAFIHRQTEMVFINGLTEVVLFNDGQTDKPNYCGMQPKNIMT